MTETSRWACPYCGAPMRIDERDRPGVGRVLAHVCLGCGAEGPSGAVGARPKAALAAALDAVGAALARVDVLGGDAPEDLAVQLGAALASYGAAEPVEDRIGEKSEGGEDCA